MITASDVLKAGHTAVITGASSGIGRAAALDFAAKGMNVWMLDIDAEDLELAKQLVASKKVSEEQVGTQKGGKRWSTASNIKISCAFLCLPQKIEGRALDVQDLDGMVAVAEEVFASDGKVNILMNNAGIGLGGGALTSMDVVQKVVGVNTYGPIHGCLAFVPKMKESGEPGIIVNTGSKQGITMPPGNLSYNMSKAALKCYTEGLEHELMKERAEGGKLKAALLVPGWVNT